MAEFKHSMEQAVEIQKTFEQRFAGKAGLSGIGIGLNERGDDLAINVFVAKEAQAKSLPKTFEGLDVVVDVAGEFSAY